MPVQLPAHPARGGGAPDFQPGPRIKALIERGLGVQVGPALPFKASLELAWQCARWRPEDVNVLYLQLTSICVHYFAKQGHLDGRLYFRSMAPGL